MSLTFWGAVILGAMAKGLRQKHPHGFEGQAGGQVLAGSLGLRLSSALSPLPLLARGLTAFVGVAVFSRALVQGLLLSVMVFISFAVSAGTGTDPSLERSPSQDLAAGRREKSVTLFLLGKCITARCSAETRPAKCLPVPLYAWIAREAIEPPRYGVQGPPQQRSPGGRGVPGAEEGSSCRGQSRRWAGSPVPPCRLFS